MNSGQERCKKLPIWKVSGLIFRFKPQILALCAVSVCLPILVSNVEVARAQGQPSEFQRLDRKRRLDYHTRFLRQVARSTPVAEVAFNIEEVLAALRYIAENGTERNKKAAKAVGLIFSRTKDATAKQLCLAAMKRIGNKTARNEMLRIYRDASVPVEWRNACAEYLQIEPLQPSKSRDSVGSQLKASQQP